MNWKKDANYRCPFWIGKKDANYRCPFWIGKKEGNYRCHLWTGKKEAKGDCFFWTGKKPGYTLRPFSVGKGKLTINVFYVVELSQYEAYNIYLLDMENV